MDWVLGGNMQLLRKHLREGSLGIVYFCWQGGGGDLRYACVIFRKWIRKKKPFWKWHLLVFKQFVCLHRCKSGKLFTQYTKREGKKKLRKIEKWETARKPIQEQVTFATIPYTVNKYTQTEDSSELSNCFSWTIDLTIVLLPWKSPGHPFRECQVTSNISQCSIHVQQ